MGDIVQSFYDIGCSFKDEMARNYNEIFSKNIEKILAIELSDYSLQIYDLDAIESRIFLRVTSSNGGNLFPFLFLSEKLSDGLNKAFKNMKKYLKNDDLESFEESLENIQIEKILSITNEYLNNKNYYVALMKNGKFFNEIYPYIIDEYIKLSNKGDVLKDGFCFIENEAKIGFDAKLNFCSVVDLPTSLQKSTKYRLLPLSNESALFINSGFEKVFSNQAFRFRLFGLSYYLLPTIFAKDKSKFLNAIIKASSEDKGDFARKIRLENRLENLTKKLEDENLSNKILFTFLFAEASNNAIVLKQMIEDVAPSLIKFAANLMQKYDINASNFSKYIKKEQIGDEIYIKDYINEPLRLAKFIFKKEKITNLGEIFSIIYKKIMLGNNQKNNPKREFSKVLSGYFKDDTDFKKHQNFLLFMSELGVVENIENLLNGANMEHQNYEEIYKEKFENVELLNTIRAKEFYILGAFCRFIQRWQFAKDSDTLAKYLDSIGSLNLQNIDRVFRKTHDSAKKYNMHGDEYNMLLNEYMNIKSIITKNDNISIDKANIAFVMGSIDFENYKKQKGE